MSVYEDFKSMFKLQFYNNIDENLKNRDTFNPIFTFSRIHRDKIKVTVQNKQLPRYVVSEFINMEDINNVPDHMARKVGIMFAKAFYNKYLMETGRYKRRERFSLHQHEGLDNDPIE